jgi:arginine decarboxylase
MTDTPWTVARARELYNVDDWGEGYVDIDPAGRLVVRPRRAADPRAIELPALAAELKALGLSPPVLVRFPGILRDRVDTLCGAFARATAEAGYRGRYTAVYPIKVNQQRRVVEAILAHGAGRVGLEAGSKPELMAVLGLATAENSTIVCNGYKDREYVRLALLGLRLGHRVHLVVEKPSELETVLREGRETGIRPVLGLRLRLASIGKGKWQNTGGERSKFGLSAEQVLEVLERLRAEGMLDCLQLMHFHMGSQVANVQDVQRALREAARYYAALRAAGAEIRVVDVGGGLGVDYEGTSCRSFCSMNYSVQEYANNVVYALGEVCEERGLPHPDLVTESGRAMTAHHALLITEVVDVAPAPGLVAPAAPDEDEPRLVRELWETYQGLSARGAVEAFHDAVHGLEEAQTLFTHGVLSLAQRARAESLYFAIAQRLRGLLSPSTRGHRELLDELNEKLADKYICNFSLFQSLPDAWAIDQVFPIVPLHRLDEAPDRRGVVHDLTCDSDGQVDLYVDGAGIETSLPLHTRRPGEPYLLGIFLVGAYQEILGDVHNLFGDTHSVNVELADDGRWRLDEPLYGDTVRDVLGFVHLEADRLVAAYRRLGVAAGLDRTVLEAHLSELRAGLEGYTYLEE